MYSFDQGDFLGGVWSKTAQGNWRDPKYPKAMNVCQNGIPVETGAWVRRSGFSHGGYTRQGQAGRVIELDFEDTSPYLTEFTNGYLRFWASTTSGLALATMNDSVTIAAISTANPAVVQLSATMPTYWATGNTFFFSALGTNNPLLQGRRFIGTVIDTTHISIADEIAGATIDGSTLGTFVSGTINLVQELTTPFTANLWSTLRLIQAEEDAYLLQSTVLPQFLDVTPPVGSQFATFSLEDVEFLDGPYMDAFTNGVQATPNQLTGIVQLSLSFPAYVSTTSYAVGDIVSYSSANWQSTVDENVGNTPTAGAYWTEVFAASAINNGQGFLSSDVGRLIRLFSEPALWLIGTTYAAETVVAYNPTGNPGQATYWQSLTSSNTGNIPGADNTNWQLVAPGAALPQAPDTGAPLQAAGPAQWTWGRIVSLANLIPGNVADVAQIGNMTQNGGLAAAFNGVSSQTEANSAVLGGGNSGQVLTINAYVGQNYSGCTPSSFKIASATVFPSSDQGLVEFNYGAISGPDPAAITYTITASLYGANSPPSSYNNGTLLGTAIAAQNLTPTIVDSATVYYYGTSPVTVISTDTTDTWAYVWVVLSATFQSSYGTLGYPWFSAAGTVQVAQVEFVNAVAGTSSNGINVELIGPQLLYSQAIRTWQLGLYSQTTGYPSCGCWSDGRLWLGGLIPNRFDASCPNGNTGASITFSPTDQYNNVTDGSAISEVFNSDSTNQIYWMQAEQQGIICGTPGGEFLIFAPSTAAGISALNIDSKRVTKIRCANILPARCEHTNVLVQFHQRKLMEYFPDIFSGKFTAPNLAEKWKNLTVSGIAEIAYQQELAPVVWMRLNNGSLIGATYKRDTLMTSSGPTFIAAHNHPLGSGNMVVSITSGPSEDGELDALSAVTLDSAGLYHVETLADLYEEGDAIPNAWFLDEATTPTSFTVGSTSITLNGLWYLNGQTCTAFLNGLDCGDWPVSSGSMTVNFYGQTGQAEKQLTAAFAAAFTAVTPMAVGFCFTSQAQLCRAIDPQLIGARTGPALGKIRRVNRFAALLVNTVGIFFGTRFSKLHAALFKSPGGTVYASNAPFNGVYKDNIQDDNSFEGQMCWQVTRPWPATIAAIQGFNDVSET